MVDFFQLPHFAIFNVADVCITSAAVLIMILAVIKNVGIEGEHYIRDATAAGGTATTTEPLPQDPEPADEPTERPDRES